jgi:hypothetical protein
MAVTWGAIGFVAGFGIEMIHNVWPNSITSRVDIWPAALALPGFFGALLFSLVLGIVGRRHRFHELSLPQFTAWGAVGGLLVSLMPAAMVTVGFGDAKVSLWQITGALAGPCILGGAVAAAGSLVLARRAEDRELLAAARDVADVGLTEEEARELIGGR